MDEMIARQFEGEGEGGWPKGRAEAKDAAKVEGSAHAQGVEGCENSR